MGWMLVVIVALLPAQDPTADGDHAVARRECNRGDQRMAAGDFDEAEVAYQAGLDACEGEALHRWVVLCRYGLANAQLFGGRLAEAHANLTQVREELARCPVPDVEQVIDETTAIYYAMLEDWNKASQYYEAALAGRSEDQVPARTALNYGHTLVSAGRLELAEPMLHRALQGYRAQEEPTGIAQCLMYLADVASERGEFELAGDWIAEAQELEIAPQTWMEIRRRECDLARWLGDEGDVERLYDEAMERADRLPANLALAARVGFLRLAMSLGDARATACEEALVRQLEVATDPTWIARANLALGVYYKATGRWLESVERLRQARTEFEAVNSPLALSALATEGAIHLLRGDLIQACAEGEEVLELARRMDHRLAMAQALNLVANIQLELGDGEGARESFLECLAIRRERNQRREIAQAQIGVGTCLDRMGRTAEARATLEQAAREAADASDRYTLGRVWARLAELSSRLGQHDDAVANATRAIEVFREYRSPEEELELLQVLAHAELASGDLAAVAGRLDRVEALLERPSLRGLRGLERARRRSVYAAWDALAQDLTARELEAATDPAARQQVLQRGLARASAWKAQSLKDNWSGASRDPSRQRSLGLLGELREDLGQWSQGAAPPAGLMERLHQQAQEFEEVTTDADTLTEPRTPRPPAPLPGSALIEFVERSERLSAYVIRPDGLDWVDLGARQELLDLAGAFLASIRERAPFEVVRDTGTALQTRLIAPLLDRVPASTSRLCIVPSHSLSGLPFGAIPTGRPQDPPPGSPFLALRYLGDDFELGYAPSSSAYAMFLQQEAPRHVGKALVLGAPESRLFADASGPRGETTRACVCRQHGPGHRPVLRPLEFARLELQRVAQAWIQSSDVPAERQVELLTELVDEDTMADLESPWLDLHVGERATPSRLTRADLADYALVYVAAHGIADPELRGQTGLVLASTGVDDGFLSLEEVVQLHLNGPLVVLSACRTGVGRILPGDGMQSMAWAFLYAGASGVVASLWNVDDERTWRLMSQFLRHHAREGLRPAEALRRAAQGARTASGGRGVTVLGDVAARGDDRAHPYYWAGFLYIGDPR